MGGYMARKNWCRTSRWCSPARRARGDLELAAAALQASPKMLIEEELYDFGDGDASSITCGRADSAKPVLIVGHNPAIARLALLSSEGRGVAARSRRREVSDRRSAIIDFEAGTWSASKTARESS